MLGFQNTAKDWGGSVMNLAGCGVREDIYGKDVVSTMNKVTNVKKVLEESRNAIENSVKISKVLFLIHLLSYVYHSE